MVISNIQHQCLLWLLLSSQLMATPLFPLHCWLYLNALVSPSFCLALTHVSIMDQTASDLSVNRNQHLERWRWMTVSVFKTSAPTTHFTWQSPWPLPKSLHTWKPSHLPQVSQFSAHIHPRRTMRVLSLSNFILTMPSFYFPVRLDNMASLLFHLLLTSF